MSIENRAEHKLTIDIIKANSFGLALMLPVLLIFGIPYYLCWPEQFTLEYFSQLMGHGQAPVWKSLLIVGTLLAGIIAHELIHGMVWAMFAKNGFRSIKFGVLWQMITPYCHCKEALLIKQYILGAIMPAILMGLLPAIAAIALGNIGWLIFGFFFTTAAAGDFMIIYLLRNEHSTDLVKDHPSEAGCFVYRNPTV